MKEKSPIPPLPAITPQLPLPNNTSPPLHAVVALVSIISGAGGGKIFTPLRSVFSSPIFNCEPTKEIKKKKERSRTTVLILVPLLYNKIKKITR